MQTMKPYVTNRTIRPIHTTPLAESRVQLITSHLSFVSIHTSYVICFTITNFMLHYSFTHPSQHAHNWPVQQNLPIIHRLHHPATEL